MTDQVNEQRALLTRAADLEARRQAARASRNVDQEQRLVEELRRLRARYIALEVNP